MRPRVARIWELIWTAWAKSPVMPVRAATKRLPKLWPSRSPCGEAVLEELREEVLVLGEGDEAVADVAGGKHVEVFAETAGGAAVVGDGDDGGELADEGGEMLERRVGDGGGASGRGDEGLESAEERGEAGSAADGDDSKLARGGHASAH